MHQHKINIKKQSKNLTKGRIAYRAVIDDWMIPYTAAGTPNPPKSAPSCCGDVDPYVTHGSKRHLDRFSLFCRARACDQHTDTQTTLRATPAATCCILSPVHTSKKVKATSSKHLLLGHVAVFGNNNVEATFDFVEATFDFVAFNNVASTSLLVWTEFYALHVCDAA